VFPQALEHKFNALGINIHEPKYLTWCKAGPHLKNAKDYERKWFNFFEINKKAMKGQTLNEGRKIMAEYGSKTNY
jgi:hypothetical protein